MKKVLMIMVVCALCSSVSADLITNGTFDTDIAGWTADWGMVNSWTAPGNPGGSLLVEGAALQAVSLQAGVLYTLSLDVQNISTTNSFDLGIAIDGPGSYSVDGGAAVAGYQSVSNASPNIGPGTPWATYSWTIQSAAATSMTLIMEGSWGSPAIANYDNVSITPEPATISLLLLGAGALIRRKR